MCTGSVGGALLSGLVGSAGVTPAVAAQAIFTELSKQLLAGEATSSGCWMSCQGCTHVFVAVHPPVAHLTAGSIQHAHQCLRRNVRHVLPLAPAGSGFNLTSQAFLQSLLSGAQATLAAGANDAAPPSTDPAAATQAASETMALVNSLLQQVRCWAGTATGPRLPAVGLARVGRHGSGGESLASSCLLLPPRPCRSSQLAPRHHILCTPTAGSDHSGAKRAGRGGQDGAGALPAPSGSSAASATASLVLPVVALPGWGGGHPQREAKKWPLAAFSLSRLSCQLILPTAHPAALTTSPATHACRCSPGWPKCARLTWRPPQPSWPAAN